ncbi:M3 family oligoendopeptidase [Aestuariivirga litoralis]|uniref:M3 family oligoendopeptidase n=1 Tax=Aestuariivirga litoralis TaxID=2650924 RepID=UPI0018C58C5A|nr:M3 family oligoendopeptidase [Aestuariivirga litoralis]MBG1233311.1 M3 family oligoendopeptidase [Aestuariivirga litoralis]
MAAKTNSVKLPEWNLNDLYSAPDSPAFKADLDKGEKLSNQFAAAHKGKIAQYDGAKLAGAIKEYEALSDLLGRVGSYSQLYYVGDTTDSARAKFYGDVNARITDISTQLLFFELELNRVDDAALAAAIKVPTLAHYKPWLDNLRAEKPYQLDDKTEQLFLEKSQTAAGAFNRLFDETMAGLRFHADGQELSLEPTLNLLQSPNEVTRKSASEALARTFGSNIKLFTLITNTLAKDKEISDKWRGFADIAAARHLSNRVEPEVVDALVAAVREAYPKLSHRYYKMKAKWLGKDKLMHWDRNAPLPSEDTREIEWPEAEAAVLKAYGDFAPEMAAIAKDFFDKNWIDAPSRPGKAPGAFAHPTVPSAHPYVLLNYMGKTRDVMTLAHELGHGVHQVLAAKQGALMASTPLTLAETASVFGEMLTFQSLLSATTDKKKRKILLASKTEDMINTVVRQIAFYQFERKVHTARKDGELTPEQLNQFWMDVQKESLGDGIEFGPGYEVFWTYIGHFIHSPFYVYAYAFGDCLVNSLYARYRESEQGFQAKYFEMLKAGGTKHHSELLKPFGLDATNPDFWQKGLSVISSFIDELETL